MTFGTWRHFRVSLFAFLFAVWTFAFDIQALPGTLSLIVGRFSSSSLIRLHKNFENTSNVGDVFPNSICHSWRVRFCNFLTRRKIRISFHLSTCLKFESALIADFVMSHKFRELAVLFFRIGNFIIAYRCELIINRVFAYSSVNTFHAG